MNLEADLQAVKRIFIDYPKQLTSAKEELQRVHQELCDINHVFELANLSGPDTMKLSKEYKELRRHRRKIKNEIESLELVEHLKGKVQQHEITNTIGRVRKLEENRSKRTYTMRVRPDLQKYVEGSV